MAAPKLILLEPNCVYHIFAHAVHANDFFYDDENKRFFLEKWKHFSKGYFKTFAYCLLSNHFHFAVKVENEAVLRATIEEQRLLRAQKKIEKLKSQLSIKQLVASCELATSCLIDNSISNEDVQLLLSKQINNFLSSYTQSLNKQRNRKGTLVRERFGRIKVENRPYLKELICYIHHNPVHHFNVENYSDWTFSSYNFYAFEVENELIDQKTILNLFENLKEFLSYHKEYQEKKRFIDIENEVLNDQNIKI
jgi:hypothetical protein